MVPPFKCNAEEVERHPHIQRTGRGHHPRPRRPHCSLLRRCAGDPLGGTVLLRRPVPTCQFLFHLTTRPSLLQLDKQERRCRGKGRWLGPPPTWSTCASHWWREARPGPSLGHSPLELRWYQRKTRRRHWGWMGTFLWPGQSSESRDGLADVLLPRRQRTGSLKLSALARTTFCTSPPESQRDSDRHPRGSGVGEITNWWKVILSNHPCETLVSSWSSADLDFFSRISQRLLFSLSVSLSPSNPQARRKGTSQRHGIN